MPGQCRAELRPTYQELSSTQSQDVTPPQTETENRAQQSLRLAPPRNVFQPTSQTPPPVNRYTRPRKGEGGGWLAVPTAPHRLREPGIRNSLLVLTHTVADANPPGESLPRPRDTAKVGSVALSTEQIPVQVVGSANDSNLCNCFENIRSLYRSRTLSRIASKGHSRWGRF